MREIKFRAFVKDTKKMFPVHSLEFSSLEEQPVEVSGCGNVDCGTCTDFYELEQVELMQYTGTKDKNDVEIYEKDYVRFGGIIALVVWSDKYCQFRLDDGTATISLNIHHKSDYEVIGNICENPELL
ncbi:YopX family protein [Candidatus Enterococcus clewellii]|uniref:YopX protein domain-containing protein n=1 Tax=Candidatus Enterococcus clewellii TaxID=1834193 RepID=A0A242K7Z5_9ENTE|nr:YopX family protein [Enterococcus sp. 9E7_DIV0242]OTP17272.1 hypothetical protein A5888_001410 [Enterococcus sp. 9E7_DIV0242]